MSCFPICITCCKFQESINCGSPNALQPPSEQPTLLIQGKMQHWTLQHSSADFCAALVRIALQQHEGEIHIKNETKAYYSAL